MFKGFGNSPETAAVVSRSWDPRAVWVEAIGVRRGKGVQRRGHWAPRATGRAGQGDRLSTGVGKIRKGCSFPSSVVWIH